MLGWRSMKRSQDKGVHKCNLFGIFFVRFPQNPYPACPGLPWERSASQINRAAQPLRRVAEGTKAVLILPMLLGAFDHRSPKTGCAAVRRSGSSIQKPVQNHISFQQQYT